MLFSSGRIGRLGGDHATHGPFQRSDGLLSHRLAPVVVDAVVHRGISDDHFRDLGILLSPQGEPLTQSIVEELATLPRLLLIAGHYEGIDERVIEEIGPREISLGDYVLSGGELAAAVIIDSVVRTLPGALGDAASAEQDSFVNGLLDYPHYTRPEEIDGRPVPEVLLSGNHAAIARWRLKQSLGRTWLRRPDLLEKVELDKEQQKLLDEFITEYNEH